jgi:hypothetical protein
MKATFESEQELEEETIHVLIKHLPPHKVVRLLALWQFGTGDYVQERDSAFVGETVDSLFELAADGQGRRRSTQSLLLLEFEARNNANEGLLIRGELNLIDDTSDSHRRPAREGPPRRPVSRQRSEQGALRVLL